MTTDGSDSAVTPIMKERYGCRHYRIPLILSEYSSYHGLGYPEDPLLPAFAIAVAQLKMLANRIKDARSTRGDETRNLKS
jgi:hypothetical protein